MFQSFHFTVKKLTVDKIESVDIEKKENNEIQDNNIGLYRTVSKFKTKKIRFCYTMIIRKIRKIIHDSKNKFKLFNQGNTSIVAFIF